MITNPVIDICKQAQRAAMRHGATDAQVASARRMVEALGDESALRAFDATVGEWRSGTLLAEAGLAARRRR